MDRNDLNNFVDAMEASPDVEKMRAFIRMTPHDRAAYLYNLRAYTRSDEISLRKRSTCSICSASWNR
jgi:gluconate kinase